MQTLIYRFRKTLIYADFLTTSELLYGNIYIIDVWTQFRTYENKIKDELHLDWR